MESQSGQITISRNDERDIGIREVRVWIDAELVATLKYREQVTRSVAPGTHTVRVHNTLFGKQMEVDVAAGAHVHFSTANRSGCATSMIFLLGAGPIYIALERKEA
ncbi:hypothetical protein OSCT_1971 [Oscillochloris trichoides DG-6]|uniref:PEGA domain-containing protein n=1 Tax=Oscillochloris trichoides DG-6 TaxID=765420 RepID=E1IF70_9CHLR|nr:hypothetical protein [Oscillochloris trichoides]EFO80169.1 hypothetical protein OSCT_1971 [Oscillochloris trichoides DG-6]